jgi:hypothetical protein
MVTCGVSGARVSKPSTVLCRSATIRIIKRVGTKRHAKANPSESAQNFGP